MINGYFGNPYQMNGSPYPHYEIIRVNGENGAKAFQMSPNSNILLLDETAPLIWLATTDGGGYKELKAFTITPYEPEKPTDVKSLEERIIKLEEMLNESDKCNSKRSSKSEQRIQQDGGN